MSPRATQLPSSGTCDWEVRLATAPSSTGMEEIGQGSCEERQIVDREVTGRVYAEDLVLGLLAQGTGPDGRAAQSARDRAKSDNPALVKNSGNR